jgi:hypothetical protein
MANLGAGLRAIGQALQAGRYREASRLSLEAATLRPTSPVELVELVRRLVYFNHGEALRGIGAALLARPSWSAAAEADVAAMLSMLGEQALASRLLDRSMALLGQHPSHLYNRSQMHLYSGRLAEAEADLRACLRQEPGMAKAHWALSKLPAGPASGNDIAAAQAWATRIAPDGVDEAYLRFALFNQLDRAGETGLAWSELDRGCRVKRALLRYRAEDAARLFAALRDAFPAGTANRSDASAAASPVPIFIIGMHRSGTTLLERMLGSHSQVSEGGELYDLPAQLRLAVDRHFAGPLAVEAVEQSAGLDYAAIGAGYLERIRWRAAGRPMLVDKLPSNFLNAGFIERALPRAKLIHMQREPMDTCFSNLKELFSSACPYSYDAAELAAYYAGYRQLMAHWQAVLPGFVLDVRYEDLARDPEAQCRRILDFCGLDWEPGCVDPRGSQRAVNTASSAQVREPVHQRGIGAWRRYEAQLEPLRADLARHGIG